MVLTSEEIKNTIQKYSNKNTKISRDVKNGKLIKIKNGLYETDPNVNGYLLAGSIYGPSYLSFEFALSYHGLIPEKSTIYTSATCNKKKKKMYENNFGTFSYRDVPAGVFALGINRIEEDGYEYQIATPEKAICDKLYTLSPIKNMKELGNILLDDLEIDMDELISLDMEHLQEIADLYRSTNVELFCRYMKR